MANRYTDTLINLLGDGKPHFELELALAMCKFVPPEAALRASRHRGLRGVDDPTIPLEIKIQSGMKALVRVTLTHLEKRKIVVAERLDGKRLWRLVDEERLAWAKAIREMPGKEEQHAATNQG